MSDEVPNDIRLTEAQRRGLTFVGVREAGIAVVYTYVDGRNTGNLEATDFARTRSPYAFEWGYAGCGPAALAHSMIARAADETVADRMYQEFKRAVVQRWPEDGFVMTARELAEHLEALVREQTASGSRDWGRE